jgi:glyoxylase-like metal-dependent hydrolase (beta-lactamase superfamily II)
MTTRPTIHSHASAEGGIFANAYLIETARGVVAVDATLTVSESLALRSRLMALAKPLLAVLVTHAHPDHVAGIANLVGDADVPIVALRSVERLMRASEEPKRAQWGPIFGAEWIPAWTYPNRLMDDREVVTFDGLDFRVYDLGAGGDCDANALWVMEAAPPAAFVGDLVFNGTHSYLADGHVLAWLANLERARSILEDVPVLYPGHGGPGSPALLGAQRDYLLAYCAAVRSLADGAPTLSEPAREELIGRMERYLPDAPLAFMIALSADRVAGELYDG